MDLWVVAAAAGAGYLAKHLQNLPSSEKERLVESSSKFSIHTSLESKNLLQQIRDKTCPLRRLARKRALRDASSEQKDRLDRRVLDTEQLESTSNDSHSRRRMASTTGSSDIVKEEEYSVLWLSSLPPGFSGRENISQYMEFVDADCSPFEYGKFNLLKSRPPGYFIKPLNSLQSGLAPQLYIEHEKVEEYGYGSLPSPSIPTMRPLLITEGTEKLSRSNSAPLSIWSNSCEETIPSDACWNENCASSRDPGLDNNLIKLRVRKSGSKKRVSGEASHSPGSSNLMLLFMIGIIVGIIWRIIANENEVKILNEQLKQASNLVQDLQEELEMKDNLSVKDLANEDSQSLSTKIPSSLNQELIPLVVEPQPNKPETSEIFSYVTRIANAKMAEDTVLRSEIEAELEAELERLELTLKTSVPDRTSGFTKLDLEFEADTIQEDMKLDLLGKHYDDDSSEADYDGESGTAMDQTLPPNYAVSPRELTIRLHELIESRLAARVKELETALQKSQNRLQFLESECIASQHITSAAESPDSVY